MRIIFWITLFLLLNGLYASTYKITVSDSNNTSVIKNDLTFFDIVSASKNKKGTTFILNLTPEEALQIKMLYNIEPYELKFRENRDAYSDLEEINNRINNISLDNSSLVKVFTIGNSVENRAIKAIRISGSEDTDLPEILFAGLHHAREWISYEVPLSIAEFIVSNYTSNSYIKSILDNSVLWFVPIINPDGYLYSWEEDRMWRYNRKVHPDSTVGVDLNRNYDASWIKVDYIHGEKPFSEPETQAVRNLINGQTANIPQNRKIQNLDGLITYHSFGQLILYPPGSTDEPPAEEKLYKDLGSNMSSQIFSQCGSNYLIMQITGLYKTFGEMTEWFMINNNNKPAFTFELRPQMGSSAGFDLSADQINDTVKENIAAAFYFISTIISNTDDINMDQDHNGISDVIQGTEYEYECSRDDIIPDDSNSDDSDLIDSINDADQQKTDSESSEFDTVINETDNEVQDVSPDKNNLNSSGCSLTKLI